MTKMSIDRRGFLVMSGAATAGGLLGGLALPAQAQGPALTGKLEFANADWLQPNRGPAIWGVISQFGALHPQLQFDKVEYPNEAYQNAMRTQVGAGEGPDIMALNITLFDQFAEAGLLEPLDGVVNEAPLNSTAAAGKRKGVQLGYNWQFTNNAFSWNTEILDAAKVKPPTTPQELLDTAVEIRRATGKVGFAHRHQMNETNNWWFDFANWIFGFGGEWSDGSKLTIDRPENIEAVAWFKRLYDSGAMPIGDDASTFRQKFAQNQVGMIIDNSSAITTICGGPGQIPGTQVMASKLPFPTNGFAQSRAFIAVNANAKNKEAAKAFMAWMYTPQTQLALSKVMGVSTLSVDTPINPEFLAANPWAAAYQQQGVIGEAHTANVPGFETRTPKIQVIVLTQVTKVLTENMAPDAALKAAQEQADREIV
jgi:multiple sugar transport system substrate-binding protein